MKIFKDVFIWDNVPDFFLVIVQLVLWFGEGG